MNALDPLLRPRSIAMIGASSDPSRGNGRTLRYLIQGGFDGPLFAVNPRRAEVQGLRSWPSIESLPQPVDCAIVALPAQEVLATLRQCAAAGTRAAVVFAGGFAETGEEGRQVQAEITRLCRETGMRVLGPNSLGAYDARDRSFMTFSSMFEEGFASGGRIGMVTQSGGWGSEARRRAADRGMSVVQWASTGNEADVDAAEVLSSMAMDDEIDVILLYLEGVRDAPRLRGALETARRRRKPVVAIKVGRTAAGQAAAASHTASLTGEDRAFDAVCRHYGAHRADSIDELLDVAYAALHGIRHDRMPRGPATAILSPSGGFAVHMTDQAVRLGLQLPVTPEPVQRAVLEMTPFASVANPVDVTGQVLNKLGDFGRALALLLEAPCYDAVDVYVGMAGAAPALRDQWVDALSEAASRHPHKWLSVAVLAKPETVARYEAAGFAVFEDTARLLNAHAALVRMSAAFARSPDAEGAPGASAPIAWPHLPASEVDAKRVLREAGIGMPREALCASAEEGASTADAFGTAVAVKVVSADIAHKTEVGGVVLNLAGADAVGGAIRAMEQRVRTACPAARIEGYLLSEMAPDGVDCLLGLRHDPALGPLVIFGAGGVMAEWLDDVSIRVAPVDLDGARAMIEDTRIRKMLQGWRGGHAADVEALAAAIVAVSRLAQPGEPPRNLEINPLRVLPAGRGVLALDALIV
jgi:acyl-CoA synthetase (NDP forming)